MEAGDEVLCPYCGQWLWIAVDLAGGRRQRWMTDCEVCCRSIDVEASIDETGEVRVVATSEDAGGP